MTESDSPSTPARIDVTGLDQGATSVFGSSTHIHEFTHDALHLLGYPCH